MIIVDVANFPHNYSFNLINLVGRYFLTLASNPIDSIYYVRHNVPSELSFTDVLPNAYSCRQKATSYRIVQKFTATVGRTGSELNLCMTDLLIFAQCTCGVRSGIVYFTLGDVSQDARAIYISC
jgi:hypothetical protein